MSGAAATAARPGLRVHAHANPSSMVAGAFGRGAVRAALAAELADGSATLTHSAAPEALDAALADGAEVLLLTGRAPLHDLPDRAPALRWISYTSAGVEWLVRAGLPPGVALTNASGTHEPKAAEFALTAVLMLHHGVPQLVTAQRERRWAPRFGPTSAGTTALVLGMGAVGAAAAGALAAHGLRVVGNSRSGRPHPPVAVMTRGDGFRAHLPETDVLVIALPATAETAGLIGRAELDLLPARAGVVNIGRGESLDHEALAAKLADGSLAGAVLDALPVEPLPPGSPLWDTPNLVVTAHGGLYDPTAYGRRCLAAFAANLRRYRAGEPLRQRVDPARGY